MLFCTRAFFASGLMSKWRWWAGCGEMARLFRPAKCCSGLGVWPACSVLAATAAFNSAWWSKRPLLWRATGWAWAGCSPGGAANIRPVCNTDHHLQVSASDCQSNPSPVFIHPTNFCSTSSAALNWTALQQEISIQRLTEGGARLRSDGIKINK